MQQKGTIINLRFIFLSVSMLFCYAASSTAQNLGDSIFGTGLACQVLQSAKEYKTRNIYTSLNSSIIDSLPDEKLLQAITDHLRSQMEPDLSDEYDVLMKTPQPGRTIYVISQVETEVNNGGFKQLFSSSANRLSHEAEKAFQEIHASHFAELIKEANILFRNEGSSAKLKELDQKFISLYDREDIKKLSINYIRKNKKAFNIH